jgi:hypothetical protein
MAMLNNVFKIGGGFEIIHLRETLLVVDKLNTYHPGQYPVTGSAAENVRKCGLRYKN